MDYKLSWRGVLLFGALAVALYALAPLDVRPTPALSAPLAQATATPTLPPLRGYSAEWAVQSFPEAGINCVVDRASLSGRAFAGVPGTPVP